jgi:hypothetical protein
VASVAQDWPVTRRQGRVEQTLLRHLLTTTTTTTAHAAAYAFLFFFIYFPLQTVPRVEWMRGRANELTSDYYAKESS